MRTRDEINVGSRSTLPLRVSMGLLCALAAISTASAADFRSARCFEIEHVGPERIAEGAKAGMFSAASHAFGAADVWCHWVDPSAPGVEWVFPRSEQKPELVARIDRAKGSVTHGSRSAGKLRIVRAYDLTISPLPVPLSLEDLQRQAMREVVAPGEFDFGMSLVQSGAMTGFEDPIDVPRIQRVQPGTREVYLEEGLPWRGYWWPFEGVPMARDNESPLMKYDRAVFSSTGSNPHSGDWEFERHSLSGVEWGGHCNGWAAASVLYPEPRTAKKDPASGITFSVSDQKALLTELSFCVQYSFYGQRYNGYRGQDLLDINPGLFHEVLEYHVGTLKKPVILDYVPEEKVDNHVVTGYRMKIDRVGGVSNRYRVKLSVRMAGYEETLNQLTGAAAQYQRTYQYTLDTDQNGRIINGQWESSNPDFVWVAISERYCEWENPRLDAAHVLRFVSSR